MAANHAPVSTKIIAYLPHREAGHGLRQRKRPAGLRLADEQSLPKPQPDYALSVSGAAGEQHQALRLRPTPQAQAGESRLLHKRPEFACSLFLPLARDFNTLGINLLRQSSSCWREFIKFIGG